MKRFKNTFYRCILILLVGIAWAGQTTAFSLNDIDSVRSRVEDWRDAWENKDIDRFASFYSPMFRSKGLDRTAWTARKARLFQNPGAISLKLENLSVFVEGDQASVQFIQHYQSPLRTDVGEKSMIFTRVDRTWRIVSETWRPIGPAPDPDDYPPAAAAAAAAPPSPAAQEPSEPAEVPPVPPVDGPRQMPSTGVPVYDIVLGTGVGVSRIGYRAETQSEHIAIGLNRFAIPESFTIEGKRPRIVIDIRQVSAWQGPLKRSIDGRHIRQIRTFLHKNENRLRVVLDLYPDRDYLIDQMYDMTANVYTIGVEDVR